MAINTTWSVGNLTRIEADGGVIQAVWSLVAQVDEEGEIAQEGGKNRFTYDASDAGSSLTNR